MTVLGREKICIKYRFSSGICKCTRNLDLPIMQYLVICFPGHSEFPYMSMMYLLKSLDE